MYIYFYIFRFYLFIFEKRGMGERNINQLPLICALSGLQTLNPGMCSGQESSWQLFTLQDDTQGQMHTSFLFLIFKRILFIYF